LVGVRLVARTVRGVESILAEEIRAGGFGTVERLGHREVWFSHASDRVLELRCADDVFLVGATVRGIDRSRAGLRILTAAADAVPARELQALRERFGGPRQPMSVDVSASFLGRRNFNRYDLEDAVGKPLAAKMRLPYYERRAGVAPPTGAMTWRLTIEDDRALLALRIGPAPLHRRSYRRITRPGSVHPPLAAAMIRLAQPATGSRLLDPCCGAGTIPIEAADHKLTIIGSDYDPAAIEAARTNGSGITWLTADAGSLPLASGSIDLVITNPPWDRQVPAAGLFKHHFWPELRRVLHSDGRAVVLLTEADTRLLNAKKAGLTTHTRHPISLFGAHPEIAVLRRS
jgi:23S rRNA G2445 N2-methylase RlmL